MDLQPQTKPGYCKVSRSQPQTEGGRKLRAYREGLGESCPTFGERFGFSALRIGRYERGDRMPDLATMKLFAEAGICAIEDWAEPPLEAVSDGGA